MPNLGLGVKFHLVHFYPVQTATINQTSFFFTIADNLNKTLIDGRLSQTLWYTVHCIYPVSCCLERKLGINRFLLSPEIERVGLAYRQFKGPSTHIFFADLSPKFARDGKKLRALNINPGQIHSGMPLQISITFVRLNCPARKSSGVDCSLFFMGERSLQSTAGR